MQHTCTFLQHTCSCPLYTISYIVQKLNLSITLGKHIYSKYIFFKYLDTHLKTLTNKTEHHSASYKKAIVYVQGQRGGKCIIVCGHKPSRVTAPSCKIGPYNTQHNITFLDAFHDADEQDRSEQPRFVVVWDNVNLAVLVRNWFTNDKQFEVVYVPLTRHLFSGLEKAHIWPPTTCPHASSAGLRPVETLR